MGGGVSADLGGNISEKMTRGQLSSLCGDAWDLGLWARLPKDDQGLTNRSDIFEAFDKIEDEVRDVFSQYCPSGEINSKTLLKLLKDCKLLNKKFNATSCDLIFSHCLAHNQIKAKSIAFPLFRLSLLPEIATKKDMYIIQLLIKISSSDGPSKTNTTKFYEATTAEAAAFGAVPEGDEEEAPEAYVSAVSRSASESTKEDLAAIKLQNIQRGKIASLKLKSTRETKALVENPPDANKFQAVSVGAELETACEQMFFKFTGPKGQMDGKTFVKLCRDVGIITAKFTSIKAELIFEKSKVVACNDSRYAAATFCGKRVGYQVFRSITVVLILDEKKETSMEALVTAIGASTGPVIHATKVSTTAYGC